MAGRGNIINITGLVPGSDESHELQSIHPINDLIAALGNYLARSFIHRTPIEVSYFQNVINKKADEIEELKPLSFEGNQRVGELIATVSIAAAVNKINEAHDSKQTDFIAAWQKSGQNDSIEKFTGKGSWDGFICQSTDPSVVSADSKIKIVGIEVKSLMVNPKETLLNLNTILNSRMKKFSKHFRIDGSIAAILIPLYTDDPTTSIDFNLDQAINDILDNVGDVTSALVFISVDKSPVNATIATRVCFIKKNIKIDSNKAETTELVRIPFYIFNNK